MKRHIYSVRRARINLTHAIKDEIRGSVNPSRFVAHSTLVAAREAAVRDLIASVRAEKNP